jgi:putative acetyltransferase
MKHSIRKPIPSELPALAQLWYDGWQEAHADHVPASLKEIRTLGSFQTRLTEHIETTGVCGPVGAPLGLCITIDTEIHQLFVSPAAQGTGAAAALINDGLERIKTAGHTSAFLDVIPENARAIAFYEKMGWKKQKVETVMLVTLDEPYPLPCLIMTKDL